MRTIGVVTVGRSDFGIYLSVLRAIEAAADLKLHLFVSGAHLSQQFGWTVGEIEQSGIAIGDCVDMLLAADTPEAVAKSMGLGIIGFAQAFRRNRPDLLVVLGDRFEMHAAATAAVPFKIPIAHIHGGEVTRGAIDDAFRHAITKYSHLHFVSTEQHAKRVIQLGEEPWRVTVSGAPALDNLTTMKLLSRSALEEELGMRLDGQPLLVTYHPVTLQYEQTEWQIKQLLQALSSYENQMVFTKPNADTHGQRIIAAMESFCDERGNATLVDNLGTQKYFSLMKEAAAMVGNSSSGILEAASFELPVVNVGIRQQGRQRSNNVIDAGNQAEEITAGMDKALSPAFREGLSGMTNVYGQGNAAGAIVERLQSVTLDDALLLKSFHDISY